MDKIKRIFLFFCLTAIVFSFLNSVVYVEGIHNGNFEETILVSESQWLYQAMKEKNWEFDEPLIIPKGWGPNPMSISKGEYHLINNPEKAHSGNICIKIKGDIHAGDSPIQVSASDQIVLSFWARTPEDIETAKIYGVLYSYGSDQQGKVKFLDDALCFERKIGKEWQRIEGTISIPATSIRTGETINQVKIVLRSREIAVYFDDVDVKLIKSNENNQLKKKENEGEKKSSQSTGLTKDASIVFRTDFTEWQKIDTVPVGWDLADNLLPIGWNIEERPGEGGFIRRIVNSDTQFLECGKYNLFLDGRIISQPIFGLYQKTLRISVVAKGKGGFFNVHVRQYDHPDAKKINLFAGNVIKETTGEEWRKYEETVTMDPGRGSSIARIELVGKRVIIGKVEVSLVEPVNLTRHIYTIPLIEQPPQIDGSFSEKEWSNTVGMKNGFMNYGTRSLVERQTEYRITSDNKKLYIVIRTPLRNGLKRTIKEPDGNVWEDESFEIYINPTPKESKPPAVYQFVINSLGTVFDMVSRPESNDKKWNCQGLEVATGQQEGLWVLEVGIPLTEVGIKPGVLFGMNLARNLQDPTEPSTITGFPYKDWSNMALCKIISGAPAIYWEYRIDIDETARQYRGSLFGTIKNLAEEDKTYRIISLIGNEKDIQVLNLLPGKSQTVMLHGKEPLLSQTLISFEVEDKDDEKLISQGVIFNPKREVSVDPNKIMAMAPDGKKDVIEFYPVQRKITVRLNNLAGRAYVNFGKNYGQSEIFVYKEGKKIFKQIVPEMLIIENTGYLTFPFHFQENGLYDISVFVYDKKRNLVEYIADTIERKETPWSGNQLGKDRIIVPPFTPIITKDNSVFCLGREIQFGRGGLPSAIKSQGKDILTSPIKLVLNSNGKYESSDTLKGDLKWKEKSKDRIIIESNIPFSNMSVKTNILMEYDGMLRYEMELLPTKEIEINSLTLEIPLKEISYFHWASGIRGNSYCFMMNLPPEGEYRDPKVPIWKPDHSYKEVADKGLLQTLYFPPGDGLIWSSVGVSSKNIYGNFLPFLWLGNTKYGLAWFADNDRGWINDPQHPCFELFRKGTETLLKVHFITGPVKMKEPRCIIFGLMPTPVKPKITGANIAIKVASFGFGNNFINEAQGLTYHDYYLARECFRHERVSGAILHYIANQEFPMGDPVVKYMKSEWVTEPFSFYDETLHSLPFRFFGTNPENYISVRTCSIPSRTDYVMYVLNENMAQGIIDGVYLDNSYPHVCVNLQHENCGYIREDGKIQGGYHLFETREFIKRAVVLSNLHKTKWPHFGVHTTSAMVIPCFSFGDIYIDGEWNYDDFMDFFGLPYIEVFGAGAWGGNQGWLPMMGKGKSLDKKELRKLTRTFLAAIKLYDMWIWHAYCDINLLQEIRKIEELFGIAEKDSRFVGYWEKENEVISGLPPGVKASYYVRPGKGALIYLSNFKKEKQEVSLKIDFKKWDISVDKVIDAENNQEINLSNGEFVLSVEGHDFRLIKVEKLQ